MLASESPRDARPPSVKSLQRLLETSAFQCFSQLLDFSEPLWAHGTPKAHALGSTGITIPRAKSILPKAPGAAHPDGAMGRRPRARPRLRIAVHGFNPALSGPSKLLAVLAPLPRPIGTRLLTS